MAAKKAAVKKNRFMVMHSDCGSDDQLERVCEGSYATKGDAQAAAERALDSGEIEPGSIAIVEIVGRGKTSGVTWE